MINFFTKRLTGTTIAFYSTILSSAYLLSACSGDPANPEVTAEQFAACRVGDNYHDECFGKTTTLTAIVEHYSSDGVHMSVRTSCDSPDSLFNVDAVNLDRQYSEENKDKCVKVFAEIGAKNTIYPDITVEETVWIETAQQFGARKTREQFVAGGWESIEEFNNAKKAGIESRSDWLALQAEIRMKKLADAEWEQIPSWPAGLAGFSFDQAASDPAAKGCNDLVQARWSEYKKRTTRFAYPVIYDPLTQSRYFFLLNEEIDQQDVLIERFSPVWRSKKSPNHYLFYSAENRFSSWSIDENGTFRDAVLQRDGEIFDTSKILEEIVAIMNKVRPNIEPSEYGRYGIVPDRSHGSEIKSCDRSTYQTIENIPFRVRVKGNAGGQYLTIRDVLQAK